MSDTDYSKTQVSDWRYLGRELVKRTCDPIQHFPFVAYMLIAIVGLGGLGVWAELLKIGISNSPIGLANVITSVLTFFPALVGAAAIQLLLASANDRIFIAFAMLIMFVFFAFAILLPFFSVTHPFIVLFLSGVCSVFAVWAWWITNGDNPTFQKIPPPNDAATGGSTDRKLSGTLEGFEA